MPDLIQNPSNGAATLNAEDGTITYTPEAEFSGEDRFIYGLIDALGGTATGEVKITVNTPPVAEDDETITAPGDPVVIPVLSNDTDADDQALTLTLSQPPSSGAAAVNEDSTVTYTPNEGFSGDDTFEYTVSDPFGSTASAIVSLRVNSLPIAVNDAVDHASDQLVWTVDEVTGSVASANVAGQLLTITPTPDAFGPGTVVLTVTDPAEARAQTTVEIDFAPLDDPLRFVLNDFSPGNGAQGVSEVGVDLQWQTEDPDGPPVAGYGIEVGSDPDNLTPLDLVGAEVLSYTFDLLSDGRFSFGQNVFWRVRVLEADVAGPVLEHQLSLSDLVPETSYGVSVSVTDAANNITSEEVRFTTLALPDILPPQFEQRPDVTPTQTTATVTFEMNEPVTGTVVYGLSESALTGSASTSSVDVRQSVLLGNLTPGTSYVFRVRVVDAAGNTFESGSFSFQTLTA